MLLREYAIKRWFVIPLPLTNVSALPAETWTWIPEIVPFQSCCIPCLENDTALACYIFDTHQPISLFFVDNKVILLSKVCKYYFSPSHFIFETWYTAWLKRHNFRGSCFPGSADISYERHDNKSPFDSILSQHISAKNNYIWLICVEVMWATSVSFFLFEIQCYFWRANMVH